VGVDKVTLMGASARASATVRAVVTASLLCVFIAGCGSHAKTAKPHLGKGGDTSAPSTTKGTTFTYQQLTIRFPATSTDEQKAVFAAYQSFWQAMYSAGLDPLHNRAGLTTVTDGGAKQVLLSYFARLDQQKQTKKGPIVLGPALPRFTKTSATPAASTATVQECADMNGSRVLDAQGKPVNPADPHTTTIQVTLNRTASGWIVVAYEEKGRGCVVKGA
jgi:hypothetical protein